MLVENLDLIPEGLQDQFEEIEIDGKKMYQDKDALDLKRHLSNAKADKEKHLASLKSVSDRLAEFEASQESKLQEARDKALADAESKGDIKAIKERYEQQMADLKERVEKETRESVTKELSQKEADTKAAGIAETIAASKAVDEKAAKSLKKLLSDRVKVDAETGKEYFLDDNGGALSVDRAGFEQLVFDEFPHLVKAAISTNGTGGANGSGNGGGAPAVNKKAEEAKKKGDLNSFIAAKLNR